MRRRRFEKADGSIRTLGDAELERKASGVAERVARLDAERRAKGLPVFGIGGIVVALVPSKPDVPVPPRRWKSPVATSAPTPAPTPPPTPARPPRPLPPSLRDIAARPAPHVVASYEVSGGRSQALPTGALPAPTPAPKALPDMPTGSGTHRF